jgi:hypothetical protein
MPKVLTKDETVGCTHSGTVSLQSSQKLKVSSAPVLTRDEIEGKSISGCTITKTTDQSGTTVTDACKNVKDVTGGLSTKLKVGNKPVALASLSGTTDGYAAKLTPIPALKASAGQTKLTAS